MKRYLDHLEGRHKKIIDLTLLRTQRVYDKLFPEAWSCPVIVVAGTNGKGSVLHTLESVYRTAGLKTALYTSPHLYDFRERLRIAGSMLSEKRWMDVFSQLDARPDTKTLTFFEFTTLASLCLAAEEDPDVLLLEIGLGGKHDAVNVVPRSLSVISNIALDHMDWLGDSRELIAAEKAGIILEGIPVVLGDLDPPHVIAQTASALQAPLLAVGNAWSYSQDVSDRGLIRFHSTQGSILSLTCPESLNPSNVSTALAALDVMQDVLPVSDSNKQQGVGNAFVPARQQRVIDEGVTFVFDVAHNPQAVESMLDQCLPKKCSGQIWCLFSALATKDVTSMLSLFKGVAANWLLFQLESRRAMPLSTLSEIFDNNYPQYPYEAGELNALWLQLRTRIQPGDIVLVFGSFQVVAALQPYIILEAKGEKYE